MNESSLAKVIHGAGCGFREFQVFGNGGDGWPKDTVFIGAVGRVSVHRDCPVRQIHPVKLCRITYMFPPAQVRLHCQCHEIKRTGHHRKVVPSFFVNRT